MEDLIQREDAIKWFEPYADRGLKIPVDTVIQNIKDIPSAENKSENATRCYEFLKTKLGEDIVDSKKEFELWFDRMVWHVKECDRLAREPKQGEWIETSEGTMCGNCHKFPYDDGEYHIANWHSDFCPNCGARMVK